MTAPLPDGFPKPRGGKPRAKTEDASTRSRRNREYGARRQATVRRWFEELTGARARFAGRKANEETWSHLPVRVEVKSGAQCGPAATAYLKAERQAQLVRAVGDVRPFVFASAPEGMGDFLIVVRASQFRDVVESLGYTIDRF